MCTCAGGEKSRMNLHVCMLKENDCYKAGRTIVPKGVMVHSTGANNPNLRRYVGPDDGLLGESSSRNWNQSGVGACVHAFIGRQKDGTVAIYQTLPWTMRGWHSASGPKGSANNTHISFEICEDDLSDETYFRAVYQEAVELTAYLCQRYGLDPKADGVVICHQEGHQRGIASNHADVLHWFPMYGKSMDDFRADVDQAMEEETVTQEQFNKMMEVYLKSRTKLAASDWAKEPLRQAVERGFTDGTSPQGFATRQEVAAMLNAALK